MEIPPEALETDDSIMLSDLKVKSGVADPRLQASTGMRALDHAVEGSYPTRHQLVTDTLATPRGPPMKRRYWVL